MTRVGSWLATASVLSLCWGSVAAAQEAEAEMAEAEVETIVTIGTRSRGRTVSDTPVPVDVFGQDEIEGVSFTDTQNLLQTLVPSYNVARQPISDGATFIRPAELRGLPSDKTLVLVNGKRRHRAALVTIGGEGTQGPDVATIPSSALKGLEVLRDGAAAQYGSDAIAGVMNFQLKDNSEGGSLSAHVGQFYEGDGEEVTITGNIGLPLLDSGFVSVSGEFSTAQPTVRGEQYCQTFGDSFGDLDGSGDFSDGDLVGFLGGLPNNSCVYDVAGGFDTDGDGIADRFGPDVDGDQLPDYTDQRYANNLPGIVQPWGTPHAEAFRVFLNTGYELSESAELYGFTNFSHSQGDGSFFYRYFGNGTLELLRDADGSVFNPVDVKYPSGFTPRFFGTVVDYSGTGGIRGELDNGITYDVFGRYGHNEIQYQLKNTYNPSFGPASPKEFRPGDLVNEEYAIAGDLGYELDTGMFASPISLQAGAEYREESYEIVEGDPLSYTAGPFANQDPFGFCDDSGAATDAGLAVIANGSSLDCSDPSDPVYTAVGVGSNGFPGYGPDVAGEFSRSSYGVYFDTAVDVTSSLFMNAAVRFEDYEDFGTTTDYKVAARYAFTPEFALRASVGTGFRAPTPGQLSTTNVSTRLPNGVPVATGLFPAFSAAAQALGASELKPEESFSYTAGLIGGLGDLSVTIDYYSIELTDRFRAISTLDASADPRVTDTLLAAGVPNAELIGGVNFFQNAFDTTTQGVDVVATYSLDWGATGMTDVSASFNYNQTEIDAVKTFIPSYFGPNDDPIGYLNDEAVFDTENGDPDWRAIFQATHFVGPMSFLGRINVYGPYENAANSTLETIQEFGTTVFLDLEATYRPEDSIALTLGVRNVTDTFPDEGEIGETCCGRVYRSDSLVDWQGGYYYGRITKEF